MLEIYCSKYNRLEGKTEKVDDRFCSSQAKPSTREKCTGDCNVGGWRYSAWTEVRGAAVASSLGALWFANSL